jgi:hypothetical protein
MTEDAQGFHAPQTITPEDLADDLAVLVWENFTDFVSEWEGDSTLDELKLVDADGNADEHAVEEALIFLLWAHTRGAQQAFVGRAQPELLKRTLDALHEAVFEDMVENGTPRSQLPVFEQRASARYAEYNTAAAKSDASVGEAVVQHLTASSDPPATSVDIVTARAVEMAGPLRDYLEDVELIP